MDAKKRHFPERHYEGTASGPFAALNPTVRRFPLGPPKTDAQSSDEAPVEGADRQPTKERAPTDLKDEVRAEDVQRQWRSRDNRKGRHALVITPEVDGNAKYLTPPPTNNAKEVLKGIWKMFSTCPYWDVSYLVATIFSLGSAVWVINAFFVWLPLVDPSTAFNNESTLGGGITAMIGATIFEVGSVLLMIEAVNENRSECFGWALEEALEERGLIRVRPMRECGHHHKNKGNFVGKGKVSEGSYLNSLFPGFLYYLLHMRVPAAGYTLLGSPLLISGHYNDQSDVTLNEPTSRDARRWIWWPTWHELSTHYFKEVGFLACLSQMIGATIFWIAGFTALPPILNRLTSTAAQNGAYWLPQVIGGTGFIVSGTLFMLETQKNWYTPAPKVLGWHIAVWNLIGGIGFTLCGALGFASGNSGALYEASLATFWGSWCFLIGSVIQWYESLDKHPVELDESSGQDAKLQPV